MGPLLPNSAENRCLTYRQNLVVGLLHKKLLPDTFVLGAALRMVHAGKPIRDRQDPDQRLGRIKADQRTESKRAPRASELKWTQLTTEIEPELKRYRKQAGMRDQGSGNEMGGKGTRPEKATKVHDLEPKQARKRFDPTPSWNLPQPKPPVGPGPGYFFTLGSGHHTHGFGISGPFET